ncbi:hypothetical protein GEMRC1_004848 [Eukaryota sp. GEM-RC1]
MQRSSKTENHTNPSKLASTSSSLDPVHSRERLHPPPSSNPVAADTVATLENYDVTMSLTEVLRQFSDIEISFAATDGSDICDESG